jgi:hypothetical protein
MKRATDILSTAVDGYPAFSFTDAPARVASIVDFGHGTPTTVWDRSRTDYILRPWKYPIKSLFSDLAVRPVVQAVPWEVA